jgi:hypothetical protein
VDEPREPVTPPGTVRLVADLDLVVPRVSPWRDPLLEVADRVVTGDIPAVSYNASRDGDALRYLYDEGVALRRVAGVLGYAYAATKDRAFRRALASGVALNATRWPDWNPGHPLDTAQVATAVALAYAWGAGELARDERDEVVSALRDRVLRPYCLEDGELARFRTSAGNQCTVVATAVVLAGLAVRSDDADAASSALADGAVALAGLREADGSGRSPAGGPTVEGLMYTAYEAAHLALLHATCRSNADDREVSRTLSGCLPGLDVLADWTERCGTVVEPAMGDAWDVYPWVDRATAVAGLAAWPTAGGRVRRLLDGLQARAVLTVPGWGSLPVPDGIAELVVSGLRPAATVPAEPPAVQSFAPREGADGSFWGGASHGELRAFLSATPNDAPHAHRDVGNVVVMQGDQPVLSDLGQRDYAYTGARVWRRSTKAHTTIGARRPDGRVTQSGTGLGSVSAPGDDLRMDSSTAIRGVDWCREVILAASSVVVRDRLTLREPGPPRSLSLSFLLAAPVDEVRDAGDGQVAFALADGSTWELETPAGAGRVVVDARPSGPYADTAELARTLGLSHSLVVVEVELADRLDLTARLRRVETPL